MEDTASTGYILAPEIFQRTMSKILEGFNDVICHTDDVLIHGKDHVEYDVRVHAVLQRLKEAGLSLTEKYEFSRTQIKFLGHIIDGAIEGSHHQLMSRNYNVTTVWLISLN